MNKCYSRPYPRCEIPPLTSAHLQLLSLKNFAFVSYTLLLVVIFGLYNFIYFCIRCNYLFLFINF
jgi:hypothetical protein